MQKDNHKTKIIFRKFKNGEIIALFPEVPGTNNIRTCMNYMHVGQHGSGECSVIGTKPTKPEDYASLQKELENIGYNLNIVSRISYKMDQKRIAEIRKYNTVPSDNVNDYLP